MCAVSLSKVRRSICKNQGVQEILGQGPWTSDDKEENKNFIAVINIYNYHTLLHVHTRHHNML